MNRSDALNNVMNLLRPHCSDLPIGHGKTDLDKAFALIAGVIMADSITSFLQKTKAPLPSQVNSFGLPPDSPKSSSSQVAQDSYDRIQLLAALEKAARTY